MCFLLFRIAVTLQASIIKNDYNYLDFDNDYGHKPFADSNYV